MGPMGGRKKDEERSYSFRASFIVVVRRLHPTTVTTIIIVIVAPTPFLYFFLAAALVTLPDPSFFSTALMTPTATVWRMSRTAKRPRGG